MRIYTSSREVDPATLRPGKALVLEVAPEHGAELPHGTALDDYLETETRRAADREAVVATERWQGAMDSHLTVNGVCLPFIWELEIYKAITRVLLEAIGIREAVRSHGLTRLESEPGAVRVAEAVAKVTGTELVRRPATPGPARSASGRATPGRRAILERARRYGIPSRLRPGSVVFVSYWPLDAVLDRMISERRLDPAVAIDKLPTGPARALRAAARGGWIGTPGPRDRSAARREAGDALATATSPPEIEAQGIPIGTAAHEAIIALGRRRATDDLARARMLRRLFNRRRPAAILSAWDSEPTARLIIQIAKEAAIPTFILSHGSYLLTTAARDMDFGDEILTWSSAMEYPKPPKGTPVHVVGYPAMQRRPPPTRRRPDAISATRILVLGQPTGPTGLIDGRVEMRHYLGALEAIAEVAPEATIVLRPHPVSGRAPAAAAAAHYPDASIEIDDETPIESLLADTDLCIGAASAATLQAALVGTPVITLNVTGLEWEWPLGHETAVPVVESREQLIAWLRRWVAGETLPGRDQMLDALGVNGTDGPARIIDVLAGRLS